MSNNNENFNEVNTSTKLDDIVSCNKSNEQDVGASPASPEKKKFALPKLAKKNNEEPVKVAAKPPATATPAIENDKTPAVPLTTEDQILQYQAAMRKKLKAKSNTNGAGEKEAVEPIYANEMLGNIDLCVSEKKENLVFYKWVGNHWKSLTKKRAEAEALNWLQVHHCDRATAYHARTCSDTAALTLLSKRPLPEKAKEIVIPCLNRYLMIDELGAIKNVVPERRFGMTHQINAMIDTTEEDYKPSELDQSSLFAKFLNSSIPNKLDQALAQEWVGSTLLPDARYQTALVLEGPGGNGKGVFTKIVSALHQNVAAINLEKLDGFALSELPDSSLVVVAETPKKNINEQMLKQLISGDKVVIDVKGQSQFSYEPFSKWLISCNSFPRIQDESNGVWRRLIIMKFMTEFKSSDKLMNFEKKIIDNEILLVLNWALVGLQRLLARGENGYFDIPEHIKQNTEVEKANSNNVINFMDDKYLAYADTCCTSKEFIYNTYVEYCNENSYYPVGDVQFWKRVGQKFNQVDSVQKREIGGRKKYVNLFFDLSLATDNETDNPFVTK